ncbi:MAG: phytanoyl-CoA dioxygenase family protein [Flavobacteriaceae bacterium]|jgi:ectoine hydroxylase-related dioxygenase (phytanoyl-CoA dioxygenase family)
MNNQLLLDESYPLNKKHIDFYRSHGFIKLKNIFDGDTLKYFGDFISKKVEEMTQNVDDFSERDTYGKAFLQIFNLWKEEEEIKRFVFSKKLAKIATELMEVRGVRMYHDQALFKEGNGGFTPWHADQYYWPLESDRTITAWIPLHNINKEMGPLEFSAGSQVLCDGRSLAISDESEKQIEKRLKITNFKKVSEPFVLGEISFHSGWVFHRAGPNTTDQVRKVMTIIYMDKDMKLISPKNEGQKNDWETWCPGAKVGQIINSPLNPILYEKNN